MYESHYERFFPLKLPASLNGMIDRFINIRDILANDRMTLMQSLFEKIFPIASTCYKYLMEKEVSLRDLERTLWNNCPSIDEIVQPPLNYGMHESPSIEEFDQKPEEIMYIIVSTYEIKRKKEKSKVSLYHQMCEYNGDDMKILFQFIDQILKGIHINGTLDRALHNGNSELVNILLSRGIRDCNSDAVEAYYNKKNSCHGISTDDVMQRLFLICPTAKWNCMIRDIFRKENVGEYSLLVEGSSIGRGYLEYELCKQVFDGNKFLNKETTGRHEVAILEKSEWKIWMKLYPSFPGVEKAVEILCRLTFGKNCWTIGSMF
jgi:hypothetical protein